MVKSISRYPEVVAKALKIDRFWISDTEHPLYSGDRIDILGFDRFTPYKSDPDTTCFVVEVKASEVADHAVLGQVQKSVKAMQKRGTAINHWSTTEGVVIAKTFTDTGLDLLREAGYKAFQWLDTNSGFSLREMA